MSTPVLVDCLAFEVEIAAAAAAVEIHLSVLQSVEKMKSEMSLE